MIIPQFYALLQQRNRLPLIYRTDNARAFKSNQLLQTYAALRIKYENNIPQELQQTHTAEKLTRLSRMRQGQICITQTPRPILVRDAAYQYNMLSHSATRHAPYHPVAQDTRVPQPPCAPHVRQQPPVHHCIGHEHPKYYTIRTQDSLPFSKPCDPANNTTGVLRTTRASPHCPLYILLQQTPAPGTKRATTLTEQHLRRRTTRSWKN